MSWIFRCDRCGLCEFTEGVGRRPLGGHAGTLTVAHADPREGEVELGSLVDSVEIELCWSCWNLHVDFMSGVSRPAPAPETEPAAPPPAKRSSGLADWIGPLVEAFAAGSPLPRPEDLG